MENGFSDYNYVKVVSSFPQLVNLEWKGEVNAACWHRNLIGDFSEIVSKLRLKQDLTEVSMEDLNALQLTKDGSKAREIIISDFQCLNDFGASPSLNLIRAYQRDEELDFISTDVYSFHVDRSQVGTDTFLCTYFGAASEILANSEAEQKILIPEIRRKLEALHDGPEAEFDAFLSEHFFDLHYQAKPAASPLNLGLGNLWRLAVDNPEGKVLPSIHRAPQEKDGEYRLLMIC